MTEFVDQPPTEHSTRDPWPEGFQVPDELAELKAAAEKAGWEARVGYSRAWEKQGRGKVGGQGDARWVRRHFVAIQIRRPGADLYQMNRAILGQDVDAVSDTWWDRASVQVEGRPAGMLAFRKRVKQGP